MRLAVPLSTIAGGITVFVGFASSPAPDMRMGETTGLVFVPAATFTYRPPGDYLHADWPVDPPTREVAFPSGLTMMKY